MSDYKRFVAYLYEYRENTKRENRGFVRVEARNGTCQMGFQMKVISLPEGTPLNVYGFVRIRSVLFGIPVGILRSGKSGITGRLLAPSVHMGDTAFSLNDLSGLLITGPEGRIYATQWDDVPIDPGRFTTDPSVLRNPEPDPVSREEQQSDETAEQPEKAVPEKAGVPETEPPAAYSDDMPSGDPAEPETEVSEDSGQPSGSSQEPPEKKAVHIASTEETRPLPTPASSPRERWEALSSRYPHMDPFDDDEIRDCIRLDLRDLPELRKSGWQIGNNQFLLHAFYNYRHFLMGRSASMDGAFILGVPGIFDVREQFMAGMFGFSGFKPARTESGHGSAPFGYWYRQVQ